jgi:Holliday junction resolvasome RuvABC endonuclease subunit
VGVDISFKHCGLAVFKDGICQYSTNYVVDRNEKTDKVRYSKFFDFCDQLITEYTPDLVVTEKVWLGPNSRVSLLLSELSGMLRAICLKHGTKFKTVAVSTYRSELGIQNKKNMVYQYVTKKYPDIEIDPEMDKSDAIALGEYGTMWFEKSIDKLNDYEKNNDFDYDEV